jgi:MFS family permease
MRALRHGARATIANNVSAYGFSLLATCSFGGLSRVLGSPTIAEALLFAGGAVAAFVILETLLSNFFRSDLEHERTRVVALGTVFSFVSVGLAIGAAVLAGEVVDSAIGWPLGGFVATATYIAASGVEMAIAEVLQDE